jgi:hypothetical protein
VNGGGEMAKTTKKRTLYITKSQLEGWLLEVAIRGLGKKSVLLVA